VGAGCAHQVANRRRLLIVLLITSSVMGVQAVGAWLSGSLALIAETGHMLTDVAGILLALLALHFAGRPATVERTFGYFRLEILAAVVNAVLLFVVAGLVIVEALRRLDEPPAVAGGTMLVAAVVGLAANAVSMVILHPGQQSSLNMRGAYLEVSADLLGSLAVLVAAVVVTLTDWSLVDPIVSVLIGLAILPRTWQLLREAVDVLMEATPRGVDLSTVRRHILATSGVRDVHDLHAWTIVSALPMLSAHVVVDDEVFSTERYAEVLDHLHSCLTGHFDVEHSTFQLEPAGHAEREGSFHP
jgi:cobalt-zinc-cadmium efflux system protein